MIQLLPQPSADDVFGARCNSGLTQSKAAELMGYSRRTWQAWESGIAQMPRSAYTLFVLMTDQHLIHN
jgi:DNA-binding transcriptional regulator YiaG